MRGAQRIGIAHRLVPLEDEIQALLYGLIREDAEARPRARACRRGGQGRDPRRLYRLNLEGDHGATYLEFHVVVMTAGW